MKKKKVSAVAAQVVNVKNIINIIRKIEKSKKIIGKERDKLRELSDEISGIADNADIATNSFDEAKGWLENGLDEISQQV